MFCACTRPITPAPIKAIGTMFIRRSSGRGPCSRRCPRCGHVAASASRAAQRLLDPLAQFARDHRPHAEPLLEATGGLVQQHAEACLLYTSDAADDLLCVDLGGRRIIK